MTAADRLIANGLICALCEEAFEEPDRRGTLYEHGSPTICDDCWDEEQHEGHFLRAEVDTKDMNY